MHPLSVMATSTSLPTASSELAGNEVESRLWNVVLLDDNDHSYEYVIEMLARLFYKTIEQAYRHALEVDTTGRTIVFTTEKPMAEFARDQIHAYGRDPRMERSAGSMSAVIEPAA